MANSPNSSLKLNAKMDDERGGQRQGQGEDGGEAATEAAPPLAPTAENDPDPEFVNVVAEKEDDLQPDPSNAPLHGFRLGAVVLGVCLGSLMMSLDITIIATAVPQLTTEFGDTSLIAWYPAAFTLATCSITPLAGKMAAVFPINIVYLSFMTIFLAGSILCGWAPTNNAFIAGRALAGVGSAGVAANGMTMLVKVAEPKKKPMFVGMAAACFAVGLVVAPVIGGALTAKATWRWCFWINIPVVVLSFSVIFFCFRPSRGPQSESLTHRILKLDLVGCAIFIPAVFMLLFAMQQGGQEHPWNSATIIGLFVGAGATMLLFAAWEWKRGSDAVIPPEVVSKRTVTFAVLFAFCHMGSLTIATYYLPQWFQVVQGVDPLQSGIRYLPTVGTQIVFTMLASSLALRFKYYNFWFFLAPAFLITASALYTQFTIATPASHWAGIQVIQGIAGGFGMQMSSLVVQLDLKDRHDLVPVGIALVSFLQYLGSSVTQVIAGTIFNSELRQQLTAAGLSSEQTNLLLEAGTRSVRDIAEDNFPERLTGVLEAYNSAITKTFFVPLSFASLAFFLALGIRWTKIEGAK